MKKLYVVCAVVVKFLNKSVVDQVALRQGLTAVLLFLLLLLLFSVFPPTLGIFFSCTSWRGNPKRIYAVSDIGERQAETDKYFTLLSSKGQHSAYRSTRISQCVLVQFGATVVTSEHWHIEPLPFFVQGLIQFVNLTSVFENSANKRTKAPSVLIVLPNSNKSFCQRDIVWLSRRDEEEEVEGNF